MKSLLAELNMRYFNSANGSFFNIFAAFRVSIWGEDRSAWLFV